MKRLNNDGFAALISVMLTLLIMSFVLAAILNISTDNRKFNNDNRLARQALYSAESGANEVLNLIQQNLGSGITPAQMQAADPAFLPGNCDIPNDIVIAYPGATASEVPLEGAGSGAAFTCQRITFGSGSASSTILPQETKVFKLPGGSSSVRIGWADDTINTNQPYGSADNPTVAGWGDASAGLQVQAVGIGGDLNSITEKSVYLRPRATGGAGSIDDAVISADCGVAAGCQATIGNIASVGGSTGTWVKVTAVYKTAYITFEALDGGGNPIQLNTVTIDSTGRAGNIFRRIERQITLDGGGQSATVPAEVIHAGGSLCKDFDFDETPAISIPAAQSIDGTGCKI